MRADLFISNYCMAACGGDLLGCGRTRDRGDPLDLNDGRFDGGAAIPGKPSMNEHWNLQEERKSAPLVSVVIDTYNHEAFIGEAITSVLQQEHQFGTVEVLVVDDGSRDGTAKQLSAFADRVRIVRKENGGQASALNSASPGKGRHHRVSGWRRLVASTKVAGSGWLPLAKSRGGNGGARDCGSRGGR